MSEPKRHAENRGWIESFGNYIPGFSGYLAKENRRESDSLQRKWLIDRLKRSKVGLNDYALRLTDLGALDGLPLVDRFRAKLDKLINRFASGVDGYSGFFDLVVIDERLLDKVYENDLKSMERVAALADKIEALADDTQNATLVLTPLFEDLEQVELYCDQRDDILNGLD